MMPAEWSGTDGKPHTGMVAGDPPALILIQSTANGPMTTATRLTANQAKSAIYDLADDFSWETVAKEMVARMSGDEARDFLEDFTRLYAD